MKVKSKIYSSIDYHLRLQISAKTNSSHGTYFDDLITIIASFVTTDVYISAEKFEYCRS